MSLLVPIAKWRVPFMEIIIITVMVPLVIIITILFPSDPTNEYERTHPLLDCGDTTQRYGLSNGTVTATAVRKSPFL